MKLGKKAFLSRDPLCEDFIAWCFVSTNESCWGQFNIAYGRTVVALHTPTVVAVPKVLATILINKLQILSDELSAAAAHVAGTVINKRSWLNPDEGDTGHMSGYVTWGDDGDSFYVSVADCQRAWRMAIKHSSRLGAKVMSSHQRKLLVMVKYIDNAIKGLKNVR